MIEITDHDIKYAEQILLPEGETFNDERMTFIKCMESRDVVACPGSGKTTALLAKLLILATKMPFKDGRGICVLTHTNVAIDEIKARAGAKADSLFRHPNFFGTIQSFVNRFLAIPTYRNEFKQPIHSIDMEQFFSELEYYYSNSFGLSNWLEPRGGISTLGSYWLHADLNIGKDLENDIPKLSRDTATYKKIKGIRNNLLKKGVLNYNDAFSLALRSFNTFPNLKKVFSHRFSFVFIDEMQDTDTHQLKVIEKIFVNNKIILQCLGDPNQAIYHSTTKKEMYWTPAGHPLLTFSDTMRYGATISNLLETIRVDRTISLLPNPKRESLKPHLLLFDNGEEENVIPTFTEIVMNNNLHDNSDATFKAVGWVGKDKRDENNLCIPHYFPSFEKNPASKKDYFSNLMSYIAATDSIENNDVGTHYKNIWHGIVHALKIAGCKNNETNRAFTKSSLINYLKTEKEKLYKRNMRRLSRWLLEYKNDDISITEFKNKIASRLRNYFPDTTTTAWNEFLNSNEIEMNEKKEDTSFNNIYISADGIKVSIGTVHSVKGETHTATLYLETFNYANDSNRLLPFLKGQYPEKESKKSRHIENLKIAHVAFSRPTHLMAFACRKDGVSEQDKVELKENGWEVLQINKILGAIDEEK